MPELIVKYKNKKTLEVLKDFAKYFGYSILLPASQSNKNEQTHLNGVTIINADSSVDASDLTKIYTDKSIHSSTLRNDAWQRRK